MRINPKRARQLFAAAVFLVLAGPNDAAFAQVLDTSPAPKAVLDRTPTNALSSDPVRPVSPVGDLDPGGPEAVPGMASRKAEEASPPAELIHQASFSVAGVVDTGTRSFRLIGVAATAIDQQCGSGPDVWPCGRVARAALQRFVRRRVVECRLPEVNPADGVAHCFVGGKDMAEWLVSQGWAKARARLRRGREASPG